MSGSHVGEMSTVLPEPVGEREAKTGRDSEGEIVKDHKKIEGDSVRGNEVREKERMKMWKTKLKPLTGAVQSEKIIGKKGKRCSGALELISWKIIIMIIIIHRQNCQLS